MRACLVCLPAACVVACLAIGCGSDDEQAPAVQTEEDSGLTEDSSQGGSAGHAGAGGTTVDAAPDRSPEAAAGSTNDAAPDISVEDVQQDVDTPDVDISDGSDASDAPQSPFRLTEENSFVIAEVTSGHLAFPDVARLPNGSIILVYRRGAGHVEATGRVMKQFSTDGVTWSDPEVLLDVANMDDRDPSVAVTSAGDVWVNYFQYKTYSTSDGNISAHHIFLAKSTDNGQTFSDPVQISEGSMNPDSPTLDSHGKWVDSHGNNIWVEACSSAIVEHAGQLWLPAYGGDALNLANLAAATRSRLSLYVSTDGQSWERRPILTDEATQTWLMEPSLLWLENDSALLHVRTATGTSPSSHGDMLQSTSTDLAQWTGFTTFPFVGHAPELAQLSNGVVLSGYREINDAFTHEWVSMSWSLDNGVSWTAPFRVADCNASECGYPGILELDNSRFLFVYYSPGGKQIRGVIYHYEIVP